MCLAMVPPRPGRSGRSRGGTGGGPDRRFRDTPPGDRPLRHRLADFLDLPRDVVLDLPRITIVGDLQILIQNHRGVTEYTPHRIIIATIKGFIRIEGRRLSIGSIRTDEVLVTGQMTAMEWSTKE